MDAVIHQACQPEEEQGGEEAADGVDEVVGLNIDGGAAEQQVERHHEPEEPLVLRLPSQEHRHRAHAHMTAGEGGGGTFAHLLCAQDELTEDAFDFGHQHLRVRLEVVAHGRKHACLGGFGAHGLEVVLRPCHGQKLVNHVEKEEGGEEDEPCTVGLPIAAEQVEDECGTHHVVVGIVAHVEGFAPEGAGHYLVEHQRWLAAEEGLVYLCKHVVEIGQLGAEVVGLGIPEDEAQEGREDPDDAQGTAGIEAIKPIGGSHCSEHDESGDEHARRVGQSLPVVGDEESGEEHVNQRDALHAPQAFFVVFSEVIFHNSSFCCLLYAFGGL